MYNGTKKWGTVRVTMKRMFTENHRHKKSMAKERLADRKAQCADSKNTFDIVVKAQSPRRKITAIVSLKPIIF